MKLGLLTVLGALLVGAPPSDPVDVDFATLSGFDYIEGMELPSEVTYYNEKKVKVSGFMQREDGGDGPVEFFMLINDACGCEGTPRLNEIVFCAMPEGETTEILAGSVTVEGTLYVGEETDDGIVLAIYTLDADSVSK